MNAPAFNEGMQMNQVATKPVDQLPMAPAPSEAAAVLGVIERMATNPEIDINKLEKLMEMHERIIARNARAAYYAAFAEMQAELPEIEERGNIVIHKKDAPKTPENVIQSTPYALWEDINASIKPVLAKHGFGLSFRPGQSPDGRVTVTGILCHREGHQEEATVVLQHDSSGSKNAVQAVGSSTSYGKRYAAGALLNLTSRDSLEHDDDGVAAVQITPKGKAREIDKEMRDEINACTTVEELERLWKSKAFAAEFERHPKDWQRMMVEHAAEHKKLITARPPVIDPKGQFDRMEKEGI